MLYEYLEKYLENSNDYNIIVKGNKGIFLDGCIEGHGFSLKSVIKNISNYPYLEFARSMLGENIKSFLLQIKNYGIFLKIK